MAEGRTGRCRRRLSPAPRIGRCRPSPCRTLPNDEVRVVRECLPGGRPASPDFSPIERSAEVPGSTRQPPIAPMLPAPSGRQAPPQTESVSSFTPPCSCRRHRQLGSSPRFTLSQSRPRVNPCPAGACPDSAAGKGMRGRLARRSARYRADTESGPRLRRRRDQADGKAGAVAAGAEGYAQAPAYASLRAARPCSGTLRRVPAGWIVGFAERRSATG